jgi:hypothetical protein
MSGQAVFTFVTCAALPHLLTPEVVIPYVAIGQLFVSVLLLAAVLIDSNTASPATPISLLRWKFICLGLFIANALIILWLVHVDDERSHAEEWLGDTKWGEGLREAETDFQAGRFRIYSMKVIPCPAAGQPIYDLTNELIGVTNGSLENWTYKVYQPDDNLTLRIWQQRLNGYNGRMMFLYRHMLAAMVGTSQRFDGETNISLVFPADSRPGAIIFVNECLTRGLTNSMTLEELQEWSTNIIQHYNQRPDFRTVALSRKDIPAALQTLQTNIPSCKFSYAEAPNSYFTIGPDPDPPLITFGRNSSGLIEFISIDSYGYGVLMGPKSFVPKWGNGPPWHTRKLADGIYLWHGYK